MTEENRLIDIALTPRQLEIALYDEQRLISRYCRELERLCKRKLRRKVRALLCQFGYEALQLYKEYLKEDKKLEKIDKGLAGESE